jgi:hypothetical protein
MRCVSSHFLSSVLVSHSGNAPEKRLALITASLLSLVLYNSCFSLSCGGVLGCVLLGARNRTASADFPPRVR